MEPPQFKLSLSGIFAKKDLSCSTITDENADPRHKVPLSERKAPLDAKAAYLPTGRIAKDSLKPSNVSPRTTSQPTDLLLQLEDSKADESVFTNEEASLSLDNQEFYGRECQKRRMISRLDAPYERERKMSQTLNDFLKKSTEIKKELWEKQQDDPEKSLYDGSITQALSPHFPNFTSSHFHRPTDSLSLLSQVNSSFTLRGMKSLDASQAQDPLLLLQIILDLVKNTPLPLGFNKEVVITSEEQEEFEALFGRKALECGFDQVVLRAVGHYSTQIQTKNEEIRELQRELQSYLHNSKALERENKKNTKLFSDKMTLLEKTNSELRAELVEMRKFNGEMSKSRSKSPLKAIPSGEAAAVLEEICRILAIRHPHHILKSIVKLEKVVRAVPRLEHFIRDVCECVRPAGREEGKKDCLADMEFVGKRVREWNMELKALRAFKGSLCHFVGVKEAVSDEELLRLLEHRETDEFEQHFRQVFELEDSQDVFEVAHQVFMQNHELRAFCRSIKQLLGVNEEISLSSLMLLVRQLKRR